MSGPNSPRTFDSTRATAALTVVLLSTIGVLWWQVARRRDLPESVTYGVAPLVATATFLACSPLVSPQYVVWLLPFAAICWAGGAVRSCMLTAAVVVLTMLLVETYGARFMDGGAYVHVLLLLRNGALVAVVLDGFRTITRAPAAPTVVSPDSVLVGSRA